MITSLRKCVFGAVVALVCFDAAAVFYHLCTGCDPGIRCLFSDDDPEGSTTLGPRIRWIDADVVGSTPPARGDRLLRLAGSEVPTILHFQRRLSEVCRPPVSDAGPNVDEPAELARLPLDACVATVGGQRWARVDFTSPADPAAGIRTAWLMLRPISAAALAASIIWLLLETVILAIGALVLWKRPGDTSASIFFALCAVNVVAFIGGFHWPKLVGSPELTYPLVFCGLLFAPLTLHFYAVFPRPLSVLRRWPGRTLAALYSVPALWIVLIFSCLLRIHWLFDGDRPIAELRQALGELGALVQNYVAFSGLMIVAGFAVLRHKFMHCRTVSERNQVKWLLGAAIIATGPLVYLLATAVHDRAEFIFGPWPKITVYCMSLVFTLAYATSITRYKLLEMGQIVNRGILYVGISFAATVLFWALVGAATALVGAFYFPWESAVIAGLTAMVVVVSLGWIRDRMQKAIDRRFLREKYRLDKAVRRLSEAVERLVEPSQLTRQLVQSVHDTLGATSGAVYLRGPTDDALQLACRMNWSRLPGRWPAACPLIQDLAERTISADSPTLREQGASLGCVLESEGAAIGLVLVGPKEDGKAYTPEDQSFLVALARTTALALRGAQGYRKIDSLKEELQEKVEKIAEQQRRIMILQSELLDHSRWAPASRVPQHRATAADELRHDLRGSSPCIRELLAQVAKVAVSPSSVLIRGESGTGKELLARAIHANSPRAARPFVQVHCAALSANLLESELFGHVRGAFTGADRDKVGRFEMADGGTLFLDEIGDVNHETQTKLLRVLQQKSLERVGGVETISVDVRLIAATHQNLEELIRTGRFREDLFYRLNVISLRCPSLRERPGDVFELALHFLRIYSARAGKLITRIDDDAVELLSAYSWPGNVRQLENAVERAVVLAEGDTIGTADLPAEIRSDVRQPAISWTAPEGRREVVGALERVGDALGEELSGLERQRLVAALAAAGGNKSHAARSLGIPRSTLFSKLRRHGLE